jgi:hypothetical protein
MNSHTGMGSSPILPIPSKRKLLRKRISNLDRRIAKLKYMHYLYEYVQDYEGIKEVIDKIYKLDQQKKAVRNKLKGYK